MTSIDEAAKKGPNGVHALFLKGSNFGSLLPNKFAGGNPQAWLDDEIVNTYLKLLAEREQKLAGWTKASGRGPPVQAIVSQWYQNVKGKNKAKIDEDKPAFNPKEFDGVKKWHARAGLGGKRILDTKVILIPICEGNHWRLLAIKPEVREIELLDSLNPAKRAYEQYVHLARRFLEFELGALYVAEEWKVVPNRSGHQANARDCGVFTVFNALALVKGVVPANKVTPALMLPARLQLAGTLLSGGFKGEFEY
ncbi:cysteine proteinase [Mytilinidion resinicola]|uniref:Cysteine proteinase n=1 Tax=Mytilinidion resinicola TaxID=574789 RepID=A0A6A6Z7P8_9PEZI|nr:cysteine proteinase [Mytilinidion resinicola]KAF2816295.1 cysteine proteinase [Mytilinidion resinicola]